MADETKPEEPGEKDNDDNEVGTLEAAMEARSHRPRGGRRRLMEFMGKLSRAGASEASLTRGDPQALPLPTIEADQLDANWKVAFSRVDRAVATRNPKTSAEERAESAKAIRKGLTNLADSEKIKIVAISVEEGRKKWTVEPDWAETPGFGLPADVFGQLMRIQSPAEHDQFDNGENFLDDVARVSQKPVMGTIDGKSIEPPLAAGI